MSTRPRRSERRPPLLLVLVAASMIVVPGTSEAGIAATGDSAELGVGRSIADPNGDPPIAPAPADPRTGAASDDDARQGSSMSTLRTALAGAEDGLIRTVVTMDLDVGVEAGLSADAVATQRSEIESALDGLGDELAGTASEVLTGYEVVPSAVVLLDEAGLERLLTSDAVAAVTLDQVFRLALDVSTTVVGSDALNTAGVLGDNFEGATAGRYEIAVLDSGVMNTHNAFSGRIVSQACYSQRASCPNGQTSQTGPGAGEACTWSPDCQHGTHVAGIAAGAAFPGGGHEGVARGAGIISIQVGSRLSPFECGGSSPCWGAYLSDIDSGLRRVLTLRGNGRNIASANLSLGGGAFAGTAACDAAYPSTRSIAANLQAVDVAVVAAAGNEGSTGTVSYPACLSSTYAVAATNDTDQPAGFTNHNAITDWWAPGVSINAPVSTGVNARANFSGTSMSAPHVTGAFALLRECIGNGTPAAVAADLSATGVDVTRTGITRKRIDVLEAATRNVPNNDFAAARLLPDVDLIDNAAFNVCADSEPDEPATGTPQNTIWWSWTPTASGIATVSTDDGGGNTTSFDTELSVFTGPGLGALSLVAHDNNGGAGNRSLVEIITVPGETYHIRVDGVAGASGRVNLHIERTAGTCNGLPVTILGTNAADAIVGTPGDDVIHAGPGHDTVNGGGGNDVICGGLGNDSLNGGSGNDVLVGGPGNDVLGGGVGVDTASYASAPGGVTVNLGSGLATGAAGNDSLVAVENLTGSAFNDTLVGGSGANALRGGAGNDTINGGAGNDSIFGDAGNDTLEGGPGNDTINGGAGVDTVRYLTATARVNASLTTNTATGGGGTDTLAAVENLTGSPFNDTLVGNTAANVISGGNGNDIINGGNGNDTLHGGVGNDTINGATGNDLIRGEAGNDRLTGGPGQDTCNGGPGSDTAVTCEVVAGIP